MAFFFGAEGFGTDQRASERAKTAFFGREMKVVHEQYIACFGLKFEGRLEQRHFGIS